MISEYVLVQTVQILLLFFLNPTIKASYARGEMWVVSDLSRLADKLVIYRNKGICAITGLKLSAEEKKRKKT